MNRCGAWIRRERLRKNWSQEGLCKGICTVSYLSKIEQGKAEPSDDVLRLLLDRLGLAIDDKREAEAETLSERGYEALFSGEAIPISADDVERLASCRFGQDIRLLAACFGQVSPLPPSKAEESITDVRQLALQRLLERRFDDAILLLPNAFLYWKKGEAEYMRGDYSAAVSTLETAYSLAAAQGAPRLMLDCRALIGNSFCNRLDLTNMEKHYAIARRLARALEDTTMLETIDYNVASARIETGHYEKAYAYFSARETPSLLSLHKLAICCEKTGRRDEALQALARAESMQSEYIPQDIADAFLALVRYRLEHEDYLHAEAYGALLFDTFERCRAALPMGYASFHLPWVLEWLTATRQYKRAYELLADFSR